MTIHSGHVSKMRDAWADHFIDTVTITSPVTRTYNRSTESYDTVAGSTRYTGAAWVLRAASTVEADVGESERTVRTFEVRVPYDTTGVEIDDVVTVSTASDSELVGVSGSVFEVSSGGWNTNRRIMFKEAQQ